MTSKLRHLQPWWWKWIVVLFLLPAPAAAQSYQECVDNQRRLNENAMHVRFDGPNGYKRNGVIYVEGHAYVNGPGNHEPSALVRFSSVSMADSVAIRMQTARQ